MKKVIFAVVLAMVAVITLGYLICCPSIPLHLRYPPAATPTDCFPDESPFRLETMGIDEAAQLPFDLTGSWAQREVSSSLSQVPLFGEVETITTSTLLVQMVQTGNRLDIVAKDCVIESVGSSSAGQVQIPQAYLDAMEPGRRTAVIEPYGEGYRIRQARFTRIMGANLENIETDPLPDDDDDPRVYDDDSDGHPGATVVMEGWVDGEIYLVQRNWIEMCGNVLGPDHIEGFIRWDMDQSVLDASSFLLDSTPESIPFPDRDKHYFVSCRIEPGMTCRQLLEQRDEIFAACTGEVSQSENE